MFSKISPLMTWHEERCNKDGGPRHPTDSLGWKAFDPQYPNFSFDPCNIRLGLAPYELNPFRNLSVTHSTWPVILIPYDLLPWMCIKESNYILSLLVPCPQIMGSWC